MSRKVHKNVNAVRLNQARQIFVVQFVHLAPVGNHRLHARGAVIRVEIVAVAKHVKFIFVMRGQNWFYELSHGVTVEVRRHISNARLVISARALGALGLCGQWIFIHLRYETFKLVAKLFVFLKQAGQVRVCHIIARQQIVAVHGCIFNVNGNG